MYGIGRLISVSEIEQTRSRHLIAQCDGQEGGAPKSSCQVGNRRRGAADPPFCLWATLCSLLGGRKVSRRSLGTTRDWVRSPSGRQAPVLAIPCTASRLNVGTGGQAKPQAVSGRHFGTAREPFVRATAIRGVETA